MSFLCFFSLYKVYLENKKPACLQGHTGFEMVYDGTYQSILMTR